MEISAALPLNGTGVLVTRARDQAAQLVEQLESLGAAVYIVPAIETEPLPEPAGLAKALDRIQEYDFLLFTSVNGVCYFRKHLEREGLLAAHLPPAICVGPMTADTWLKAGGDVHLVPEKFSARDLVEELGEEINGKTLLFLRPERVKTDLGPALRKRGCTVDDIILYRTVIGGENKDRLTVLLDGDDLDAVLFASPSAVEGFLQMAGGPGKVGNLLTVCIGPVTAQAAREHGMKRVISPREYTIDGMVELLVAAVAEMRDRR